MTGVGVGPAFYPDLRPCRPVYLSGAAGPALAKLDAAGYDVGVIAQPASYRCGAVAPYRTWALDNGCYSAGDSFDPAGRVRWLAGFPDPDCRFGNHGDAYESRLLQPDTGPMGDWGCLFATAPDVPFDMAATWARSEPWLATVRRLGFPVALVGQNGVEDFAPAWDEIERWDCLFLGGDTAWKQSADGLACARHARLSGRWVHAGRVNSRRRLARLASAVDSVDGTFLAFGPDTNANRLARWLDELATTPTLFG